MSDTIVCDFVFVPDGAPFPSDWAQRHPDYITLPARFTGSPAFMEQMFGSPRPAETYVFEKSARPVAALGVADDIPAAIPPT
jgi:hypothetical protein